MERLERSKTPWKSLRSPKDRSFTFAIDKMDKDETGGVLDGASALARQQREVIIPEIDTYVYGKMATGAGTKETATHSHRWIISMMRSWKGIRFSIINEVPDTGRILVVTPDVYLLMKKNPDINMETDVAEEMRLKGVIANLDGLTVVKVPKKRLPANFGFMIAHPVATVAPTKLEE